MPILFLCSCTVLRHRTNARARRTRAPPPRMDGRQPQHRHHPQQHLDVTLRCVVMFGRLFAAVTVLRRFLPVRAAQGVAREEARSAWSSQRGPVTIIYCIKYEKVSMRQFDVLNTDLCYDTLGCEVWGLWFSSQGLWFRVGFSSEALGKSCKRLVRQREPLG